MDKWDMIANLTQFVLKETGSVYGTVSRRMTAKEQRAMFGRFLGKGKIIINGQEETICNRVKVCFGLDYDDRNLVRWADL